MIPVINYADHRFLFRDVGQRTKSRTALAQRQAELDEQKRAFEATGGKIKREEEKG